MAASGVQVEPQRKKQEKWLLTRNKKRAWETDSDTSGSQTPCWGVKCVCVSVCVCACMCICLFLNSLSPYWHEWCSSFHYKSKKRIKRWKDKNFERICSGSFKARLQHWLCIYYWLCIKMQGNATAKETDTENLNWKCNWHIMNWQIQLLITLPNFFLLLKNVKVPCI